MSVVWLLSNILWTVTHLLVWIANKTMMDLRRLYFKLRERVFLEKHMDPRSTELEAFIQEELGTTLKMNDVQQPKWGEQLRSNFYIHLCPLLSYLSSCLTFFSPVSLSIFTVTYPYESTSVMNIHVCLVSRGHTPFRKRRKGSGNFFYSSLLRCSIQWWDQSQRSILHIATSIGNCYGALFEPKYSTCASFINDERHL